MWRKKGLSWRNVQALENVLLKPMINYGVIHQQILWYFAFDVMKPVVPVVKFLHSYELSHAHFWDFEVRSRSWIPSFALPHNSSRLSNGNVSLWCLEFKAEIEIFIEWEESSSSTDFEHEWLWKSAFVTDLIMLFN